MARPSLRVLLLLLLLVGAACATEEQVEHGPDTAALVAPVIITGPDPVDVEVGAIIDVVTAGVERVSSSDETVLTVTQPSDDGSAEYHAGATALVEGEAVLSVHGAGDELLYEVDVTVG